MIKRKPSKVEEGIYNVSETVGSVNGVLGGAVAMGGFLGNLLFEAITESVDNFITEKIINRLEYNKLIKRIKNNDKDLTGIDLENKKVGAYFAKKIFKALEANNTVKELNLRMMPSSWNHPRNCTPITSEGGIALGKALKNNGSLETILLNSNSLYDKGAIPIFKGLSENAKLKNLKISFRDNYLNDESAYSMADFLAKNNTMENLSINFDWNHFKDDGVASVFNALSENKKLKNFNISLKDNYSLGDKSAYAIAEFLSKNTAMESFQLCFSVNCSDEALKKIIESLKSNTTLIKLEIEGYYHKCDPNIVEELQSVIQDVNSRNKDNNVKENNKVEFTKNSNKELIFTKPKSSNSKDNDNRNNKPINPESSWHKKPSDNFKKHKPK